MYVRDQLIVPFQRQQGLSPAGFGWTLGEPPASVAPRILSKPRRFGTDQLCVEMPAPGLIKTESNTLYVEIPLGFDEAETRSKKTVKVQPMTGIYVPPGYVPGQVLNLIVFFHGFTDTYPGDGVAIDGFWDGSKHPFFKLREGLVDSGKKDVVLVAPTLGPKSQAGGLLFWPDNYLDQVMLALMAHGPYKAYPGYRPLYANIILACHSGGGVPMRMFALRSKRYAINIKECWGFDCLYGGRVEADEWIAWAKANPSKNLYVYYCDFPHRDPNKNCTSTKTNSVAFKSRADKPTNITIEKTTANNHFWVPMAHWKDLIARTTFPERPTVTTAP